MKLIKYLYFSFLIFLIIPLKIYSQDETENKKELFGLIQPAFVYYFEPNKIPNNEFKLYRTRMGFISKISQSISGQIEIDPIDPQIIKDAKIKISPSKFFSIVFGRQKIPFSLERMTSVKDLIFIDRAKIVKEMDDLGYCGRDLGIILSTDFSLSSYTFNFNFGVFNGTQNLNSGDNNNSKTFAQRLTIRKSKNFSFGINSTQRFDSASSIYFVGNGFDLSYSPWKNFTITSEVLYGRKTSTSLIGGTYLGFYYKFGELNFGLRYSKYYKNIDLKGENYIQSKIDWQLNKKFKFIFNYELSYINLKNINSKLILASTYEL